MDVLALVGDRKGIRPKNSPPVTPLPSLPSILLSRHGGCIERESQGEATNPCLPARTAVKPSCVYLVYRVFTGKYKQA